MNRIIMKPNQIYRPRKRMEIATPYKLISFCYENDLRVGQALALAIGNRDLFTIEDPELEGAIIEFISGKG
jgi:hypothetical protein